MCLTINLESSLLLNAKGLSGLSAAVRIVGLFE